MKRRAVITGIGIITPLGTGAEPFWQGVLQGRSRVRRIDRFDASAFRSQVAAQVDDFDPTAWLDRRQVGRMDRFVQFSLVSAMLALQDAGIAPAEVAPERVGVFMGTALGGVGFGEEQHAAFMGGGLRAVNPGLALTVFGGAASCAIAIHCGFLGPNETNAMSCASGAIAVGRGLRAVQQGEAEVVLAGGAEAPLWPLCYGAFANIRAMSTRNGEPESASRPFDAERDGFVMGEGAAVLVIEERSRALRRGARPYAELIGYGTSNDGYHMTAPRPDGSQAARAMQCALQDANLPPDQVGYINAHASSTPLNDVTEALAIHRALGADAVRVPVSGTKGLYGHPLGASGAIEAAVTALALHRRYLPPTVNLRRQDPQVTLPVLAGEGLERRPRRALSNSFGFGGINACLALAEV
ncbi:MAG: beta-ketoacyl-[acyl-carrier-protein] synthase family protein [Bacillota bacterium]